MLEYAKLILQKVSFDAGLFEKELHKAIGALHKDEPAKLYKWCMDFFGDVYPDAIQRAFAKFQNMPAYHDFIRMAKQTLS
jgi:hypothetical protein